MGVSLRVRIDAKEVSRAFERLAREQIPFATKLALDGLAQKVADAETAALSSVFDKATPFTLKAFGIQKATKSVPYAVVFAKDRQDKYLAPYEDGGRQFLGSKRALLNPKDIKLNQYRNIPKGALARLKGRKDIFIGAMPTKSGMVGGVWQRLPVPKLPRGTHGPPAPHRFKLLIRWGDPQPVPAKLHFGDRARRTVGANLQGEFAAAMAKAQATAR